MALRIRRSKDRTSLDPPTQTLYPAELHPTGRNVRVQQARQWRCAGYTTIISNSVKHHVLGTCFIVVHARDTCPRERPPLLCSTLDDLLRVLQLMRTVTAISPITRKRRMLDAATKQYTYFGSTAFLFLSGGYTRHPFKSYCGVATHL